MEIEGERERERENIGRASRGCREMIYIRGIYRTCSGSVSVCVVSGGVTSGGCGGIGTTAPALEGGGGHVSSNSWHVSGRSHDEQYEDEQEENGMAAVGVARGAGGLEL